MKRFFSWIVLMLEVPAVAAVFALVNDLLMPVSQWINEHWMVEALMDDISLGDLVMVPLMYLLLMGFAKVSGKICQSRNGGRLYALMVFSVLAGLFFAYCRIRGELPFEVPFTVTNYMLTGAAFSLFVNALWIYNELRRLHKARKEMMQSPESICIFFRQKPGESLATPYAYVEGGPGLVHEGIKPELPEREGRGFDGKLFMRVMDAVEDACWDKTELPDHICAFSGAYMNDEVMSIDRVDMNRLTGAYSYTDVAHPKDNSQPKVMKFSMADIRKAMKVVVNWDSLLQTARPAAPKPSAAAPGQQAAVPKQTAAPKKPAAPPMPRTREELIHEIGEYTGADIFDSSDRLGIDLQDNCSNYEKLDLQQLQRMLRDLQEHCTKGHSTWYIKHPK